MCLRMSPTICQTTQLHTPEVRTIKFTKFLYLSQIIFLGWLSSHNHERRTIHSTRSVVHWPCARMTCAYCVHRLTSTLRSPTCMSSPNFRRDVVTSTKIKGPRPLKIKTLRSFGTSATEGTRHPTQLSRHRL
jgi:hypothetical protein